MGNRAVLIYHWPVFSLIRLSRWTLVEWSNRALALVNEPDSNYAAASWPAFSAGNRHSSHPNFITCIFKRTRMSSWLSGRTEAWVCPHFWRASMIKQLGGARKLKFNARRIWRTRRPKDNYWLHLSKRTTLVAWLPLATPVAYFFGKLACGAKDFLLLHASDKDESDLYFSFKVPVLGIEDTKSSFRIVHYSSTKRQNAE